MAFSVAGYRGIADVSQISIFCVAGIAGVTPISISINIKSDAVVELKNSPSWIGGVDAAARDGVVEFFCSNREM